MRDIKKDWKKLKKILTNFDMSFNRFSNEMSKNNYFREMVDIVLEAKNV